VDRVRSHLASQALAIEPRFDWWFWLDSDMIADPPDVDRLVQSAVEIDAPLMCAVSICRKSRTPNVLSVDSRPVALGEAGGIIELQKGAFAFAVTHRRMFESVAKTLPEVDYLDDATGVASRGWPFFHPVIRNRVHYGEDFSMCSRARDAGMRIWADTRVENWHASEEIMGWTDMQGVQHTAGGASGGSPP
jgi:hypothetical protein